MLRMKKVATYISEKLELQLPRSREDSIVASRRPSLANSLLTSSGALQPPTSSDNQTVPAHEVIELLCEGVVLAPAMTLIQCKRSLWKHSGGDLKIDYRMKQQNPS